MTQAFLLPSGLTAATAPKPGKRIGKFDFKLLHSDTWEDLVSKVPERVRYDYTNVTAILVAIGWGFIETVQDMARELHLEEGKQISREINGIRCDFEKSARYIGQWRIFEEKAADWFYSKLAEDFQQLYISLCRVTEEIVDTERRKLIIAIYQAATVGNIVHEYAEYVCEQYAKYGVDYQPEAVYGSHFDKAVRFSLIYSVLADTDDKIVNEGKAKEIADISASIITKRIIKGDFGAELYKIFCRYFPEGRYERAV